ncbi:GAF sensor signal transduction histidine kinase [Christiangramia gaetbulicola]|uniref:histidine kinase n=1 Tax=Christiangramia gaetbulicola TaxID=703340 RepID=A0A2T6AHH1_9FLAO|nr:GAF domain-containing sensor histidine kinase [Christiangramia gaetbulicola]PTX43237.1 GAF sensor signal transduction histidine kinase [Christiangramia gaetbulicola]
MISPVIPANEEKRLDSIKDLDIIGSLPEETYDSITKLASAICETPIALITILDKEINWFKSKVGTSIEKSEREISFCGHAILEPQKLFEVPNTLKDERFKDNPLSIAKEGAIRFYAGAPILDEEGLPLGTLCVLDSKEHHLSDAQKTALKALAKQVEVLFNYRRKNKELEKLKDDLDENNRILREFASTVSHDLKMPLANMIITADILKAKYSGNLDEEGIKYLNYLKQSGLTLSDYINGLLDYYSSNVEANREQEFFLNDLLEDIIDLLNIAENCEINLPDNNLKIYGNSAAVGQIFMNLINNSLKYNSNEKIVIDIDCTENREFFNFSVKDNGIGIPTSKHEEIFELFTTATDSDRQGKKGHGIGLSTVKKLVGSLGGFINVTSEKGEGTCFDFSIKRYIQ